MAVVSILLGGMAGFLSALVGLIVMNLSLLAALGLWTSMGALVALIVLAFALLPKSEPVTTAQTHTA